jgi:hypothetical protein
VPRQKLRLNSLEGFTKTSPRLILEEHSHCEVPAGCGGVVLRWINPAAGLPVLLDFFHPTPATLAIDGAPTTTAHVLLAPGRHVLSIEFPEPPADDQALLILVGRLKVATPPYRDEVIVRAAADGSWLFTTSTPPAGWMTAPRPPARGWKPLVQRPVAEPAEYTPGWYTFGRVSGHGAEPLGAPPSRRRGPIRVRTVFTVPPVAP